MLWCCHLKNNCSSISGGLLDPAFYTASQLPSGLGYGWYVRRVRASVRAASARAGGARVLLVGHSAGGWLARAALGDGAWSDGLRAPTVTVSC